MANGAMTNGAMANSELPAAITGCKPRWRALECPVIGSAGQARRARHARPSAFAFARKSSLGKFRRRTHRRTGGRDCPRSRHNRCRDSRRARCRTVPRRRASQGREADSARSRAADSGKTNGRAGGARAKSGWYRGRMRTQARPRCAQRGSRPQSAPSTASPARAAGLDHLERVVRRVRSVGGDEFRIDRSARADRSACMDWRTSHARIRRGGLEGRVSDDDRTRPITNGSGAPGEIRTPNLQIRSLMLCPVELRAPWERL